MLSSRMRFAMLRLLPMAAAAVLLAGCIDYEQEITLNENGSGRFTLHYWVKEGLLTQWDDGSALFREDSVRARFSGTGVVMESVEFSPNAKDTTKHARIALRFDDLQALSRLRGLDEAAYRLDRRGDTMVFTHTVRSKHASNGMGMSEYSASYALVLPAAPIAHNGQGVDGKRVSWKYSLSDFEGDRVMTASWLRSAPSLVPQFPLPVILASGGLIVLLIVFLVVRYYKKKAATGSQG